MPHLDEVRTLPWSAEQLFDLVADVGRYPEFLPWVAGIRIRSANETELLADMLVGFRALKEVFTSRVTFDRPHHIHVAYVEGPLRRLQNDWTFRSNGSGTTVEFVVDFEFRSRLFERLAGAVLMDAFRHMVASFERRAAALYGSSSKSAVRAA